MNETVASREPFYVAVSLDTHEIFCFDERPVAPARGSGVEAVTPDTYIHVAGGGLNLAFNQAVLDEMARPFSVTDSFEQRTGTIIPVLFEAGVKPGVHSDVISENGIVVTNNPDGAVGCGYAEKRQGVSQYISEEGVGIVADAAHLRPELFRSQQDFGIAHSVVAAHGRLADRPGFLTSGRRVVMTAAEKGAKVMLMAGEHTGTEGILNLVPNTSINSDGAAKSGLDAYSQDSWAVEEANDRIRDRYPYDKRQQQIAEIIDTIGTMRALGVKHIKVRRPADIAQAA